jgi:hypothetical protein
MSWPTREAAVKELKRNGFKEQGADYRVGEFSPDSWQVMELGDDVVQRPLDEVVPGLSKAKAAAAKQGPKPGRETLPKGRKATPEPVQTDLEEAIEATPPAAKKKAAHPGDVRDRELIAKAGSYAIHMRLSPTKKLDQTAKYLGEAVGIADRWNAEHGKNGRRAMIYAVPRGKGASIPIPPDMLPELLAEKRKAPEPKVDNVEPTVPVQKVAAGKKGNGTKPPEPAEPANDLTALPAADGPYGLCVVDPVAQHDIANVALAWSRKVGFRVGLTNKAGKVVRVIDGRLGGKRPTRTAVRREGATPRAPGTGKMANATALLLRKEGATAKEINAVTDWPVGQRHINKLAKLSGATIKQMGEQHWRLIKA